MIFTCWIILFLYFRFLYIYFGGGNWVDWDSVLWWKLFYLSLHYYYTLYEDTPEKNPFHRHEGCSHLILDSNIQNESKHHHNSWALSQSVANVVVALTQSLINYFGVQVNGATAAVDKTWKLPQHSCRSKIISISSRLTRVRRPTNAPLEMRTFCSHSDALSSSALLPAAVINIHIIHWIRCVSKWLFSSEPVVAFRYKLCVEVQTHDTKIITIISVVYIWRGIFFSRLASASCYLSMLFFRCIKSKVETWISCLSSENWR